tara:strand:- start:182 stop:904 length:723 start_codon:yes stop_codon:yes gene_type:complete
MDKVSYNKWLPAELDIMEKYREKETTKVTAGYTTILDELEEVVGFRRTPASVRNKLGRMRGRAGTAAAKEINLDSYPIHKNLKLLEEPNRGGYALYSLMCSNGHIIEKEPCNWVGGCSICSGEFVGGIPKNDFRPAVVYLIYIKELKAVKIGYATGKGKEAIIRRFTRWTMPHEYEILGYDQSTRTEAAEHEQWLLNNTLDYKYFTERQDFAGWTEFRHQSIVKDLLPEYETVLDMAFRI